MNPNQSTPISFTIFMQALMLITARILIHVIADERKMRHGKQTPESENRTAAHPICEAKANFAH